MKLYILEYVQELTTNYHSDGGLVVIAADDQAAKDAARAECAGGPTNDEWNDAKVFSLADDAEEGVWLFPDAGCC